MAKIAKTGDRKKVMDTTKSTDCPKCSKPKRIGILDQLDKFFTDADSAAVPDSQDIHRHDIQVRARALRRKLEAVNFAIYESIRSRVRQGAPPEELLRWLEPGMTPSWNPLP